MDSLTLIYFAVTVNAASTYLFNYGGNTVTGLFLQFYPLQVVLLCYGGWYLVYSTGDCGYRNFKWSCNMETQRTCLPQHPTLDPAIATGFLHRTLFADTYISRLSDERCSDGVLTLLWTPFTPAVDPLCAD